MYFRTPCFEPVYGRTGKLPPHHGEREVSTWARELRALSLSKTWTRNKMHLHLPFPGRTVLLFGNIRSPRASVAGRQWGDRNCRLWVVGAVPGPCQKAYIQCLGGALYRAPFLPPTAPSARSDAASLHNVGPAPVAGGSRACQPQIGQPLTG